MSPASCVGRGTAQEVGGDTKGGTSRLHPTEEEVPGP